MLLCLVDGVDVRLGTFTVIRGMHTAIHSGFDVEKVRKGAQDCFIRTRPFCFQQVETTPNEVRDIPKDLGTIKLCISRGEFDDKVERFTPKKMKLPVNSPTNEREAKKKGVSVRVTEDVENEKSMQIPASGTLTDCTRKGSVKVFIREKFWLQAKNVIDEDSNPWRPAMNQVHEIIEHDKHCDCCLCQRKKRKEAPIVDLTIED